MDDFLVVSSSDDDIEYHGDAEDGDTLFIMQKRIRRLTAGKVERWLMENGWNFPKKCL